MTGRRVAAALIAPVAIVLLITSVGSCGSSVRSFVADRYDRVGTRDGAEVFRSGATVARVTREISDAWKPADRVTSPNGVFLRYGDDIVAVHPASAGGTEIEVADDDRGYGLWFPYIGGWFGTGGGPAGGFRGGGPGTGK